MKAAGDSRVKGLQLAANLTLPLDAVTQAIAVLGLRGSGKTHTATVLAEVRDGLLFTSEALHT